MNFLELWKIEWMKVKRSKMIPLIFVAPLLVVVSGIANLSSYFTPEYTNAWAAMFIQSALLYAYYLLPFSMIVVCVMLKGRETQNNGMTKMLTLPIKPYLLSLAKFCVLMGYLFLEMLIFLIVFVTAGVVATYITGIEETLPAGYLLRWCVVLFLSMLPGMAVMWAITVLFEKALFSVGLNILLVIPGLLAAVTPVWYLYPYCYSGYLVSCSLHEFTDGGAADTLELFPFLACAVLIFIVALGVSMAGIRKK